MPFELFKEEYRMYRREKGFDRVRFTIDHYRTSFSDHNLRVRKTEEYYPPDSGQLVKAQFVLGIDRR